MFVLLKDNKLLLVANLGYASFIHRSLWVFMRMFGRTSLTLSFL